MAALTDFKMDKCHNFDVYAVEIDDKWDFVDFQT